MPLRLIDFHHQLKAQLEELFTPSEARTHEELLLDQLLGLRLHELLLNPHGDTPETAMGQCKTILEQLRHQRPIQQILGYGYFYNQRFHVSADTLIPRRETEELVAWILEFAPTQAVELLDIGTGTGCIPITLSRLNPHFQCTAMDISPAALEVAKGNAQLHQVPISFLLADMQRYSPTPASLDFLVSNPPYIPESEKMGMDARVRDHEPHTALFVPDNAPLLPYIHIARIGQEGLKSGGHLFVETHETLTEEVANLLAESGYSAMGTRDDAQGKPRMVHAEKP